MYCKVPTRRPVFAVSQVSVSSAATKDATARRERRGNERKVSIVADDDWIVAVAVVVIVSGRAGEQSPSVMRAVYYVIVESLRL